jgi:hypothetical protein
MEGQDVVTNDDHKLGTVIAERDDCVVIEPGHVFKSKHAIPRSFLHEHDGVLRATVTKDIVDASPKVDLEHWDCSGVRLHYGLDGPFEVDPPADGVNNAEVEGQAHGVQPAPAARSQILDGTSDPAAEMPAVRDRQANAYDPAGTTANLSDENRTGGKD